MFYDVAKLSQCKSKKFINFIFTKRGCHNCFTEIFISLRAGHQRKPERSLKTSDLV
jgi:hypothetical protein